MTFVLLEGSIPAAVSLAPTREFPEFKYPRRQFVPDNFRQAVYRRSQFCFAHVMPYGALPAPAQRIRSFRLAILTVIVPLATGVPPQLK